MKLATGITEIIGKQHRRLFLLPVLLAFCCFANTFGHAFVYDDSVLIESGPIRDWRSENIEHLFDRDIWSFFYQDFSSDVKNRSPYYRPVFGLSFMINYLYAGLNPVGWHLTGVALHMIAVALAYQLLLASLSAGNGLATDSQYSEQEARWLALLGAACFAIHPAQSESVAWVAAYVNALSAIFIFGALLAYLRARRNVTGISMPWLLVGSILYALALLTKEIAAIVPVIIIGYEMLVIGGGKKWGERLRGGLAMSVPFLFLMFGYLALRVSIFGAVRFNIFNDDFPEMGVTTLKMSILTFPAVALKYVRIASWPFGLNPMYAVRYVIAPGWWSFYAPAAAIVALGFAGAVAARRSRLSRIGLIWLIVPLLPALDIRSFKAEDLVHDRYLYLPLLGAGLLLAGAVRRLNGYLSERFGSERSAWGGVGERLRPSVAIVAAALLIAMAAATVKQNQVWANDWQLWGTARESVPDSCTVNLELGRLSEEAGLDGEAIGYYEHAMRVCPGSTTVYYKLGLLYGRIGDLARAEAVFERMAEVTPFRLKRATAHFNLGVIYEKQGDLERAISHYQAGLALNPASKNAAEVRRIVDELTAKLAQGTAK